MRLSAALPNTAHRSPTFSPDGLELAYQVAGASFNGIQVIDYDTGADVSSIPGESFYPSWASTNAIAGISHGIVTVVGTSGPDTITLGSGFKILTVDVNGKSDQFSIFTFDQIEVFCGDGNDTVLGSTASEGFYASGDAGNDVLVGSPLNDTLTGGSGRNTLFGGDGNDRLNGSGGRDFLYGEVGNDRLYGNAGNDYMVGAAGVDRMWGGDGDDLLSGNSGNDKLFGEQGDDQILGGDGNDILYGGLGIDTLNGGKGSDLADDDDADLRIRDRDCPLGEHDPCRLLNAGSMQSRRSNSGSCARSCSGRISFSTRSTMLRSASSWPTPAAGTRRPCPSLLRPSDPSLSPDRTRIVFDSEGDNGGDDELWTINLDGTNPVQLTNNDSLDWEPSFSPDGTRIAFSSRRDGNLEIYSMDANGGDVRRLTNDPGSDDEPSWSPDGSKIIFATEHYGDREIATVDAATGANLTRLTNSVGNESAPVYSPEGLRIAFKSGRGGQSNLWIMSAAGEIAGPAPIN